MSESREQEYVDLVTLMNEATEGGLTEEQEDIFRNSCGAAGSYGFIKGVQFAQSLVSTYANAVEQLSGAGEDYDIETVKSYSDFLRKMFNMHLSELIEKYDKNVNTAFPNEEMSTSTAEKHNE